MGNAGAEIRVMCRSDEPAFVASLDQPGENAGALRPWCSGSRALPLDAPFQMDEGQLSGQEFGSILQVRPPTVAQMQPVNVSMPLPKLVRALKPAPRHVDEVDVAGDQLRH